MRIPERPIEPHEDCGAVCPVCYSPCYYVYRDSYGDIIGCDECVTRQDAVEADECFEYAGATRR